MSSSQSNPGFSPQESHAPTGAAAPGSAKPRDTSMARNIVGVLCPYCASVSADIRRCNACGGHFDPLSRQATQNDMGPWFLFDKDHPTRPGCSYEKIRELAVSGKIRPGTIIRGPTTKQFWSFASRAPSIANLVGYCHNCQGKASPEDYSCKSCGSVFSPETDRQHLGLAPVRLLPGRDSPAVIAAREFSPRDLGPEPAVLDAPASPAQHVLETKLPHAPRATPGVEPKAARTLPGAAFLPPTAEELAELAKASPAPIAPTPAKVEIAVPVAKPMASVPTVKARPAPAPATNASTLWDLGSLDHDRGSGGAWWWVAAVAMLALGAAGIAYIAWSQSNPGRRYLATPSTVAKSAPATSTATSTPASTATNNKLAGTATTPKLAPPEPATPDAAVPSVKAEDERATPVPHEQGAGEKDATIAPAPSADPPTTQGEQGPGDSPKAALEAAPEAPTPAPILPGPVDPVPASPTEEARETPTSPTPTSEPAKESPTHQRTAASPANGVTPELPARTTTSDVQAPRSSSEAAGAPKVKPPDQTPPEAPTASAPEAPSPAAAPSGVPSELPAHVEPATNVAPVDAVIEVRREVLAALARDGASGPDGGRFLDAWADRAGGGASAWLGKVRATLDRWRESDRIGRSLP